MKKGYVLDLSRKNCHCCGQPLTRDYFRQQELCTNSDCDIRNVKFTIPTILEPKEQK